MASVTKETNGRWRARYRDAAGKQHARRFDRKLDAQRWLDEVTTSVMTGRYVDPGAGRITVHEYAEQWRMTRQHRATTRKQVQTHFNRRLYPVLGNRRLDSIRPSDIDALIATTSKALAPATVKVFYRYVSAVFTAAVRDKRIAESPCVNISLPEVHRTQVEPLAVDTVESIVDAVPERYRALVILAAGTGLRQGEVFGLTVDRVDFTNRRLRVDRQLGSVANERPTFTPPKTRTSVRTVPLPTTVSDALLRHLAAFPAGPDGLVFTNELGAPVRRSTFNMMWTKALRDANIPHVVFHSLRHFYASLLIRHGESVVTVQKRLGHASASETLDTYSHMWPDADDTTRMAVDAVLGLSSLDARASTVRPASTVR